MFLSDASIKRPVFATVISLLLVTFGIITLNRLPLREYPDVDSPTITINTTYTGASASVVETKITQVLEGSVSGIEGLKTVESSSEDGQSSITLEFDIDTDINEAANDVRDKVSRVSGDLPDEADSPEISKRNTSNMPVLIIGLVHPTMSQLELTDYADRYLVDRFSVVDGVAQTSIFGEKRYSMRIWLSRKALAARDLTVTDIEDALNVENVELPAGRLESKDREFTLRVKQGYQTPDDFRKLVISRGDDGYLIRLGDVARVEVSAESLRDSFKADGKNMVAMAVNRQSTANTLAMINGVKKVMKEMEPTLSQGMEMIVLRDSSVFVEAAVREVVISLGIAVALVVFIIFLFLGNIRASLVPAVTVPISLISAFIVLYLLGFTVNLLTLLALVLAIGLVVDDSIVVLENINRHIEEGEPPLLAAFRGTREVGFAVIATTLVLVAVFVPISLLEGDMGKLFTEFAFAMVGAVIFSTLVALTLSPVMCSKILKCKEKEGWLSRGVEAVFARIIDVYDRILKKVIRHPFACLLLLILFCGSAWILVGRLQSELEPQEDRAALMASVTAPEGTGFNASQGYMDQVATQLNKLWTKGRRSMS